MNLKEIPIALALTTSTPLAVIDPYNVGIRTNYVQPVFNSKSKNNGVFDEFLTKMNGNPETKLKEHQSTTALVKSENISKKTDAKKRTPELENRASKVKPADSFYSNVTDKRGSKNLYRYK